jgi:hypothetical protein
MIMQVQPIIRISNNHVGLVSKPRGASRGQQGLPPEYLAPNSCNRFGKTANTIPSMSIKTKKMRPSERSVTSAPPVITEPAGLSLFHSHLCRTRTPLCQSSTNNY